MSASRRASSSVVLGVVVPHRDLVTGQFREAVECLERVEVVVEDRDLQCPPPPPVLANPYGAMSLTLSQLSGRPVAHALRLPLPTNGGAIIITRPLADTVDCLIFDLLEWLRASPRPYFGALDEGRTSCPRLPVWEEVRDRGCINCQRRHSQLDYLSPIEFEIVSSL